MMGLMLILASFGGFVSQAPKFEWRVFGIFMLAGLANAIGLIFASKALALPNFQASILIPLTATYMVFGIIGSKILLHEPITLTKIFFASLIMIGALGIGLTQNK